MGESSVGHRTNLTFAAVVAVVVLVGSGAGFRVLANHLSRPNESSPIPPGTLQKFPLAFGDWMGRDIPMDERVIIATDTDDHLNRGYYRKGESGSVGFYIAYGVQARDLMPHRPEVCYPAQGWTIDDSTVETLTLPDGTLLECQMLQFARGGLTSTSRTVLYYYIIDGAFFADVSALRNRSIWGSNSIRYVAQIQVTSGGDQLRGGEGALQSVRAFATETALRIRDLLPQGEENDHEGSAETTLDRPGETS
jgi:EpsI family protein